MKKLIIPVVLGVLLSCSHSKAQEPEFNEKIHKEFTVSANSFMGLYNINGFVKVEGYNGNKVIIDVDKTITAKTTQDLEEGKRDIKLGFDQVSDSLIVYTAAPYDTRPKSRNCNCGHREYHLTLNYIIKVPNSINMSLSTVNGGDIDVTDVSGTMKVNNVNGKITLKDVKNANNIHTINGDVSISYTTLPPDNATYYTLNGNLSVIYPTGFSADCEFKSFNGEFFTDFEEIEKLPAQTIKNTENKNGSTVYKLNKTTLIRIGKGGRRLHFETFNGNIYIKKKS
jgi:hypothetical protein